MPTVKSKSDAAEMTYPLRAAASLTGLSPELLRAWERRHAVVTPLRTPGGTRRYSAADIERLRLVKAAVDAGHRISEVAGLNLEELKGRSSRSTMAPQTPDSLEEVMVALDRLDSAECQRLLSLQLSALGPTQFARDFALPLLHEIGERWANGEFGIAGEHLASGMLRTYLGAALQPTASSLLGSKIIFATPSGERHELGLLMAALAALGAGANPLYLGIELPVEDLLHAVETSNAAVLALSLVTLPAAQATRTVSALRGGLSDEVHVWLGGVSARGVRPTQGVEHIENLEDLEQRVALLAHEGKRAR